uniref:Uncharacterized protein n=1 Tax=Rhizophora mucronata TaxID=61149 RepID=A0A2P2N7I8_RHIMU
MFSCKVGADFEEEEKRRKKENESLCIRFL